MNDLIKSFKAKINYKKNFKKTPYLLILPSMIIILLILVLPIILTFLISMSDSSLLNIGKNYNFIGLKNYIDFFKGSSYKKVIGVTFIYVFGSVGLDYSFGLLTALLLNHNFRGRPFFRTIVILPWVVPSVVLAIIWRWMVNPQQGVLNYFLNSLGIIPENFSWLTSGGTAMVVILVATVWKEYPISFLILFAGLKTIPNDLYEAASIDGANYFRKFIHIVMPGLRYVTSILVLLLTVWAFGNFAIIWLLTKGGPNDQTAVLTVFSYLNVFSYSKLGYGAAIGIIILIIALIFTILYYKLFMSKGSE